MYLIKEEISQYMFEKGLIKRIESYKKGIECSIYMSPGTLSFYIHGVDNPLTKPKKKVLEDGWDDDEDYS